MINEWRYKPSVTARGGQLAARITESGAKYHVLNEVVVTGDSRHPDERCRPVPERRLLRVKVGLCCGDRKAQRRVHAGKASAGAAVWFSLTRGLLQQKGYSAGSQHPVKRSGGVVKPKASILHQRRTQTGNPQHRAADFSNVVPRLYLGLALGRNASKNGENKAFVEASHGRKPLYLSPLNYIKCQKFGRTVDFAKNRVPKYWHA